VKRSIECQRDPGDPLVLGRADRKRVDVETAAGEQTGDPGQHTRLVLDHDRKDVLSACAQPTGCLELVE
jgi:hypothetical protein